MRPLFGSLLALLGIVGLFLSVPSPIEASGSGLAGTTSATTPSASCPTTTTTHYATLAAFTTCQSTTTTVYAPATTETCPRATTVTMTPTLEAVSTCPPGSTTTVWADAVTSSTSPLPTTTSPSQSAFDVPGVSLLASLAALAVVGFWVAARSRR